MEERIIENLSISCLNCKKRIAEQCGVCGACDTAQRRLMKKGETTEEKLIKAGKRAPRKPRIDPITLRPMRTQHGK
jgi:hypothetical protein